MKSKRTGRTRQGAAFLMLVVLVLLVIVAAAKTMVVGEISSRRSEAAALRGKSLNTAIDRTLLAELGSADPVRLPVDPQLDQWIEITASDDVIRASWYSGPQVLDEVVRPLKPNSFASSN